MDKILKQIADAVVAAKNAREDIKANTKARLALMEAIITYCIDLSYERHLDNSITSEDSDISEKSASK